jgi:HPt (histidine-containing phosphotransfer) domain-containing protein
VPEGRSSDGRDAAQVPAGDPVSPVSSERLAMLEGVSGGSALVAELVKLFVEDVPPLVERIREAARGEDADALERSAHRLKGSASTIGAEGMAEQCRQVEGFARKRDWARSEAAASSLEAEFERVKQALGEWLAAR